MKTVEESTLSNEVFRKRVDKMYIMQHEMMHDSSLKVKVMNGNKKTGSVYTLSLLPVLDCTNCSKCKKQCYDIRNDIWRKEVLKSRANNSAIHKVSPSLYWKGVEENIRFRDIKYLRVNVGGDLSNEDFGYLFKIAKSFKGVGFVAFTKNYEGANAILDKEELPSNLHLIFSRWDGVPCDNKHNIPESYVRFKNGAEVHGYECNGDCTECSERSTGCFGLKRGESVVFNAH